MKKTNLSLFTVLLSLVVLSSLNSCISSKRLAYFRNIQKDSTARIQAESFENKIIANDVLDISFSFTDVPTMALMNNPAATYTAGINGGVSGYLVDKEGSIKLPLLGSVKAIGYTKSELSNNITKLLVDKKIALEPIVTIRIVNYRVTILGEVNRPGVVTIPNEHVTLPEALAYAGDLTPFGKRDNVLLIRETDGNRIYKRFSLNEAQLFDKDLYYLQNQDILYIEPNNARAASADRTTQLIPYFFSTVSLLLVLYVQFIKN